MFVKPNRVYFTVSSSTMASLNDLIPSGVITGEDCLKLFEHARANRYAIPAINCTVSEESASGRERIN